MRHPNRGLDFALLLCALVLGGLAEWILRLPVRARQTPPGDGSCSCSRLGWAAPRCWDGYLAARGLPSAHPSPSSARPTGATGLAVPGSGWAGGSLYCRFPGGKPTHGRHLPVGRHADTLAGQPCTVGCRRAAVEQYGDRPKLDASPGQCPTPPSRFSASAPGRIDWLSGHHSPGDLPAHLPPGHLPA